MRNKVYMGDIYLHACAHELLFLTYDIEYSQLAEVHLGCVARAISAQTHGRALDGHEV